MPSLKISELPVKATLATSDILPIIDVQFGVGNYVSKQTTVGDLIEFAKNTFVSGVDIAQSVVSVNGYTGVVTISFTTLDGIAITNPQPYDVLAFDSAQNAWRNISLADETINLGTF